MPLTRLSSDSLESEADVGSQELLDRADRNGSRALWASAQTQAAAADQGLARGRVQACLESEEQRPESKPRRRVIVIPGVNLNG
jgi:hypothetical protein